MGLTFSKVIFNMISLLVSIWVLLHFTTLYLSSCSGHFGLWVDENLYFGRSSPCYTFNNCCLSETDDFRVMELEVWTFSWRERVTAADQLRPVGISHWASKNICRTARPIHNPQTAVFICVKWTSVSRNEPNKADLGRRPRVGGFMQPEACGAELL